VNPVATAYTLVTSNGTAVAPSLPSVGTITPSGGTTPSAGTDTSTPSTTTGSSGTGSTTTTTKTGSTTTTTTTPSASTLTAGGAAQFGLSDPDFGSESASQQAADLANMKSIGLRWVRVDAGWNWLEPEQGTFVWGALDQEVQSIEAAGMHPDLIIDETPSWAVDPAAAGNMWGEPASASAYGTFAGQVAARYGPMGVNTYEIWNEENYQMFWAPAPDPSLYTSMLKDAYTAIKAVEPDSTVISGGLAPAADDSAGDIAPIEFLQDMYADGAEGSFDALGDHAYSYPALPDTYETWSGWSQMDQTSPSLRSVMAANGDSAKQIWITEIGAPSAGDNSVGTTGQAQDVTQAVAAAKSTSWIGAEFFYTYEDTSDADNFGLLNADGSAKPAWTALAAALAS